MCYYIIFELNSNAAVDYKTLWYIQVARFMACCVLHYQLSNEVHSAMLLMKYVSFSHKKFDKPWHAFLAVFLQAIVTVLIEIVNIYNLITISNMIDIVMNFLALAVLAEFDDMFLLPLV